MCGASQHQLRVRDIMCGGLCLPVSGLCDPGPARLRGSTWEWGIWDGSSWKWFMPQSPHHRGCHGTCRPYAALELLNDSHLGARWSSFWWPGDLEVGSVLADPGSGGFCPTPASFLLHQQQAAPASLIVSLVHADQQADGLSAHGLPQGLSQEHAPKGL